ncbi:MAG: mannitol dehydrogenase [Ruminiclostridium sp.]|nr:mannitol dehydrogenase [Ruminiclostridium sp.]
MKKALMYGAGNIGRGFIGQLFSQSGYEVVFVDVNTEILSRLNSDRQYPVRILTGSEVKEIIVKNVRGVSGLDAVNVAEEIADADIMATAVGVNILPRIAKPVAEGLKKRWSIANMNPLNIIICENLIDANHILAGLIKQELDDRGKELFDRLVGLVAASIGRMVPVMTPQMQEGNILRVCVEEYGELPVDKDGFKGEIPAVKNMYPFSPFGFYIQRKLFIHNMGHALTAYLGKLKGYEYIWQAMEDPYIKPAVRKAMQDSAAALSREHSVALDLILDHVDDLLNRFGNRQLGDTVNRVGNDTRRKLSPNDRLIGAANLCISHGVNPVNISLGIAAAMKFDRESSANSIYGILTEKGPEAVLDEICGIKADSPLWSMVIYFYNMLGNGMELDELYGYHTL